MNTTVSSLDAEADRVLQQLGAAETQDAILISEAKLWWRRLNDEAQRIANDSEQSPKMRRLIGTPLQFENLLPESPDFIPGFQVLKHDFPSVYVRVRNYGLTFAVDWETIELGVVNQSRSSRYDNIRMLRTNGVTCARNEDGKRFVTVGELVMYLIRPCWESQAASNSRNVQT